VDQSPSAPSTGLLPSFPSIFPTQSVTQENFQEPQFEHVGFMLNILALFMANKNLNAKDVKPYIKISFIRDLFTQLHHPDERIREGIKTIIHQFYVKFVGHRSFIRRNIRDQLMTFTYEDDNYRGTPHILQFLGSIVRGFATPLKNEHKLFLVKEWSF
jgi:serine/threonine-protein phosphatase 2A regulatory subunit B'